MEQITILPFLMNRTSTGLFAPMGDTILTLPLAQEGGFRLYVPKGFLADLLEPLTSVPIQRELYKNSLLLNPIDAIAAPNSPFALDNWGTKDFLAKFGHVNATLCWSMAIEMKLLDPVPHLRRPRDPELGKVGLFPKGAALKRSLTDAKTQEISDALRQAGFNPVVGPQFEKASEFADFVASCEYVVGVYTGPMHFAASMGVKTVAIPVGDSPWAYRPLQPNAYVLAPHCDLCWVSNRRNVERFCGEDNPKCVRSLRPEQVLAAMKSLDIGKGGLAHLPEP